MENFKTLQDFDNAPIYLKEYILLAAAVSFFTIAVVAIQVSEKHWGAVVFGIVSLVFMIVQIVASKGSTRFIQYAQYEGYLQSLNEPTLKSIVIDTSVDEETKEFVIQFTEAANND